MSRRASLNHVFRTIWNPTLGVMVAVAEICSGAGGKGGTARIRVDASGAPVLRRLALALGIAIAWGAAPMATLANPSGAVAIVGQATLVNQGNKLTVTTQNGAGGNYSAINWQSFSIPAGSTTYFQQPTASSTSINRVVTNTPSLLFGTLGSNGNLVLVNQSGITVGAGAVVDTAGFTASSLRMSDADALAGRQRFGDGTASAAAVSVQGSVLARSGDVVLLGSSIDTGREALIQAPNGSTILAAGRQIEITGRGLEGISLQVQAPTDAALNLGTLKGDAVGIFAGTLKHSGVIQATTASLDGGKVVLKAAADAYVEGAGRIEATGTAGGMVDVLGNRVAVTDQAVIDVSGAQGGGTVRIGGDYQGKNPDIQNANATYFGPQASIKADATSNGDGGKVVVWADDTTRAYGSISARGGEQGGNGGFVETSGHRYLDPNGLLVNTSAARGEAGTWLLDPTNIYIAADQTTATAAGMTGTDSSANGSGPLIFQATGFATDSLLTTSTLQSNLANNSVLVSTANASGYGGGVGVISVVSPVTWSNANALTLNADANIKINANITGANARLSLLSKTGIQSTAAIEVNQLEAAASVSGDVSLPGVNKVGTFAASAPVGSITLENWALGGLTIGTVGLPTAPTSGLDSWSGATITQVPQDTRLTIANAINTRYYGNVTLTADNMAIAADITGYPAVVLQPSTAGTAIKLGGTSDLNGPGVLGLSNASLNHVAMTPNTYNGSLSIGSASSGDIEIVAGGATIPAAVALTTTLQSAGNIVVNGPLSASASDLSLLSGGNQTFNAAIDAANVVYLDAGATGAISQASSGTITAPYLVVGNAGTVDLSLAPNSVQYLAANVTGNSFKFNSAGSFFVTVDGDGCCTNGINGITVGGGTGAALLSGLGTIGQDAGATISAASLSVSAVGGINLPEANQVGSLTATNSGSGNITFNNDLDFNLRVVSNSAIPSVTGYGGGVVTVTGAGSITQTGNLSTAGGAISVTAGTDLTMNGATQSQSSGGTITYTASSGSVQLGLLDAGSAGSVYVVAGQNITDGNTAVSNNIKANYASLVASNADSGPGAIEIDTQVAQLDVDNNMVYATTGQALNPITIRNRGAALLLNVNSSADTGTLTVTNDATINVGQVSGATNISLTAAGDIRIAAGSTSAYVQAANDIALTAQTGGVYLDATAGNVAQIVSSAGNIDVLTATGFKSGTVSGYGGTVSAPNGRWLVWAPNPTTVVGCGPTSGCAPDFSQYNTSHSPTPTTPLGSGNGLMYSVAPTLSATLSGKLSKVYDSGLGISLTGATFTSISGASYGDVLSGASISGGVGALLDANVASAKVVNASGMFVSGVTDSAGKPVYGYQASASGAIGTVTPASLVINAVTDSKVYDGGTSSTGIVSVGTLFGTDSVTGATQAFASKNVLGSNGSTLLVSAYTINDGNGGANYSVTSATATGTITPVALAINAVTDSKVYNGSTSSAGVVSVGTLFGTDSVTGATQAFASKNVLGANGSTLLVSGYSLNDGNGGANYSVSSATATGTITPAALAINAVADSKVYDGGTNSPGVVSVGTLFGSDSVTGATQAFASRNVLGINGSSLHVSGYSVNDGNGGANYSVTSATAAGTIAPAALAINAVTDSKVYDGGTSSTGVVSVGTLFGSDSVTGATQAFASRNVLGASGSTLRVSGYSVNDGNGGANYSVSAGTATGTITPAALVINAVTDSKVYDGGTGSTAVVSVGALLGGDSVTGATQAFASKNVLGANASTLRVSGYSLNDGNGGANYSVSSGTATGTITVRPLSTWTASGSGQWSNAGNWDALPDGSNVLAVSIPAGVSVVYDAAVGATSLQSVTSAGGFSLTGGNLSIAGSLTTPQYNQSGGALSGAGSLSVNGAFTQTAGTIALGGPVTITQSAGNLSVGSIQGASISLAAPTGGITQSAGLVSTGLLRTQSASGTLLNDAGNRIGSFKATNTGTGNIELTNVGVLDVQGISAANGDITLVDTGGISTSGLVQANAGAVTMTANSPLTIGSSGISANNNITLTATNLTSSGNMTLNGPLTSFAGGITLNAANNFVQNSSLTAALAINVSAGGTMTFGPFAISTGNPVNYYINGQPLAPPWLAAAFGATTGDFVVSFISEFQDSLEALLVDYSYSDPLAQYRTNKISIVVEGNLCSR